MDATTLKQQQDAGLSRFDRLRKAGVFGKRLMAVGASSEGTPIYAQDGGDVRFIRFPLAQSVPGYVDIAVDQSLGDPVLSVVEGASWQPKVFEQEVAGMGCAGERWESFSSSDAALKCGDVWMAPNRKMGGGTYVKLGKDEVSRSQGLEAPQIEENRLRYDAMAAAEAAPPAAGPLPGAAPSPSAPELPLCPLAAGASGSCVPELNQVDDHWCVPAVLEMAIEYFLGQREQNRYQRDLAKALAVSPLGMPAASVPNIPAVVGNAAGQQVACAPCCADWARIKTEIAAGRPMITISADHAFLIYGYTEDPVGSPDPAVAYLQLVDPWGGVTRHDAFATHVADLAFRFWSTQAAQVGLSPAIAPHPLPPAALAGVNPPPPAAGAAGEAGQA
jgi:hypothetical protein